jgi:hypothetical protein
MLQQMNPQHGAQRRGLATFPGERIVRFDQRFQPPPWHHAFHLRQKGFPAGDFPLLPETVIFGETVLHPKDPPGGRES